MPQCRGMFTMAQVHSNCSFELLRSESSFKSLSGVNETSTTLGARAFLVNYVLQMKIVSTIQLLLIACLRGTITSVVLGHD